MDTPKRQVIVLGFRVYGLGLNNYRSFFLLYFKGAEHHVLISKAPILNRSIDAVLEHGSRPKPLKPRKPQPSTLNPGSIRFCRFNP